MNHPVPMRPLADAEVTLRNGYWHGGVRYREARVRGVEQGEDVENELSANLLPLERTRLLIARCVTRFAGQDGAEADVFRNLSMGDLQALLLQVRRMTFGERMECLLTCPACGERMDFQLNTDALLLPAAEHMQGSCEEEFTAGGVSFRVKFHIPTAGDVEDVLRKKPGALHTAVRALMAQCVESVHRRDEPDEAVPAAQWPAELISQISPRMAELDPQAELKLQLRCPACRHEFTTFFDTCNFFFQELSERERLLREEVHQLALSYHWSESDILQMTPRKRKLYLELLAGGAYE